MTIPLAEFRQRLGDPDLTIVDVRALPAYNGWRAGGASRGGHIPGAVAFPIAWLDSVDKPEVERLLQSKGILT
jgi:molybdopterin synthase sulfurtransferase